MPSSAGNIRTEDPFLDKWRNIQPLLSHILGLNVALFNSDGQFAVPPEKNSPCCQDMIRPLDSAIAVPVKEHCCLYAFDYAIEQQAKSYPCPHGCHFGVVLIDRPGSPKRVLILGPVWMGNRPGEDFCRSYAQEHGLDADYLMDQVREIPLFSHSKMVRITDFAACLIASL